MMARAGIFASARHLAVIASTFRQSAVSATDATSYSFATQPIGSASATRRVVVAVSIRGAAMTVSAVTIGGVVASQVVAATAATVHTSQWSAVVPTGTTATVAVTIAGGTAQACGIGVWTLNVGAPTGQTAVASPDIANPSMTVTTSAGNVVIGSCSYRGSSATWAAATERYDEFMDTNIRVHTGADLVASGVSADMSLTIAAFNASSAACAAAYA